MDGHGLIVRVQETLALVRLPRVRERNGGMVPWLGMEARNTNVRMPHGKRWEERR